MRKNLAFIFLALILTANCQRDRPEGEVLATINGQTLLLSEFEKELATFQSQYDRYFPGAGRVSQKLRVTLLGQMIEKRLLAQEAERLGIEVTEEELRAGIEKIQKDYPEDGFARTLETEYINLEDWKRRLKENLLTQKLIEQVILPRVSLTDEDAQSYYQAHLPDYEVPEQVQASQIVVETEQEARNILLRLKRGEDFAEIARENSLSPDSEKGGDLGFFSRGQMPPEFDQAVFSLRPGRLSSVVQSPYGYHIFKVEKKREARRLEYPEVKERIVTKLKQEKQEQEYIAWLTELKSRAEIRINQAYLAEGEGD